MSALTYLRPDVRSEDYDDWVFATPDPLRRIVIWRYRADLSEGFAGHYETAENSFAPWEEGDKLDEATLAICVKLLEEKGLT